MNMEKQYKLELMKHLLNNELPLDEKKSIVQYLSTDEMFEEILFLELLKKWVDTEIKRLMSDWMSE
jgi:hypothetical protein